MEVLQTSINHQFAVLSDECIYNLPQIYPNGRLASKEPGEVVAVLLHQGPYARFQQDLQGVALPMIEQYARGTAAQVQAIQALQVGQPQRNIPRDR